MIEKLDATIPRGSDPAPGTPGNKSSEQLREVRAKINEIIEKLNQIEKEN